MKIEFQFSLIYNTVITNFEILDNNKNLLYSYKLRKKYEIIMEKLEEIEEIIINEIKNLNNYIRITHKVL